VTDTTRSKNQLNLRLSLFKLLQRDMRHRMRKLIMGLLISTQFHTLIRIMHGVDIEMIVKTK
jgi:hypothetical protein